MNYNFFSSVQHFILGGYNVSKVFSVIVGSVVYGKITTSQAENGYYYLKSKN